MADYELMRVEVEDGYAGPTAFDALMYLSKKYLVEAHDLEFKAKMEQEAADRTYRQIANLHKMASSFNDAAEAIVVENFK